MIAMVNEDVAFETSVQFIRSLGIEVKFEVLPENTFLPGILIAGGEIIIDRTQLQFPGDILHEAGHLAVVPAAERSSLHNDNIAGRKFREAEEMMAIAWSYAAAVHLQIDPYFVFHDNGYKGGGRQIADDFRACRYFGVPMLQYAGMSAEPHQAEHTGLPAFPLMAKWLRD